MDTISTVILVVLGFLIFKQVYERFKTTKEKLQKRMQKWETEIWKKQKQ